MIRIFKGVVCVLAAITIASCDVVPKEAVELSNTVGRDLEEVHRAHRALAELHFGSIENRVNMFVDETYRPAFIKAFATEFKLDEKVLIILEKDPSKLLPVLTRFVETATKRIEKKRAELIEPIQKQKTDVIAEIDAAHRQIQAAQAVVTGHLASVRKVREVQNEILAKVGLKDIRQKVASKTAEISQKVGEFVVKGQEIEGQIGNAAAKISQIDGLIEKLKAAVSN